MGVGNTIRLFMLGFNVGIQSPHSLLPWEHKFQQHTSFNNKFPYTTHPHVDKILAFPHVPLGMDLRRRSRRGCLWVSCTRRTYHMSIARSLTGTPSARRTGHTRSFPTPAALFLRYSSCTRPSPLRCCRCIGRHHRVCTCRQCCLGAHTYPRDKQSILVSTDFFSPPRGTRHSRHLHSSSLCSTRCP